MTIGQKQIALAWGKPVTSEEGWSGTLRGIFMTSRSGKVSHLQVRRGLILRRPTTAPIAAVTQTDDDTLLLGEHSSQGNAPARGAVPFTTKTVAHCSDGATVPVRGVILEEDHSLKYLLIGTGRLVRAVPANQVQKASSGSPTIKLGLADVEALPPYASDREALRKAQAALENADPSDGQVFGAVRVGVALGRAHLSGNVRVLVEKEDAEKAVAKAPGVLEVVNEIVADWDLRIQIAEALTREGLTRQGIVTVKSHLGNVTLGGHLSSPEAIEHAVTVAQGVSGTRSVKHEIEVSTVTPAEPAPDADDVEESTPSEAPDASPASTDDPSASEP